MASQIKEKQLPNTVSLKKPLWKVFRWVPGCKCISRWSKRSKCRSSAGSRSFQKMFGSDKKKCAQFVANRLKHAKPHVSSNVCFSFSQCVQVSLCLTLHKLQACPLPNSGWPARPVSFSLLSAPDSPNTAPHPSAQPDAANFWRTAAAQGHSLPLTNRSLQTVPNCNRTNLHWVWVGGYHLF